MTDISYPFKDDGQPVISTDDDVVKIMKFDNLKKKVDRDFKVKTDVNYCLAVKSYALSGVTLMYFFGGLGLFILERCHTVLPVLSGVRTYIDEPGCIAVV